MATCTEVERPLGFPGTGAAIERTSVVEVWEKPESHGTIERETVKHEKPEWSYCTRSELVLRAIFTIGFREKHAL